MVISIVLKDLFIELLLLLRSIEHIFLTSYVSDTLRWIFKYQKFLDQETQFEKMTMIVCKNAICLLFMQIDCSQWMFGIHIYIHSLDFLLIFIKKIVHWHISKLWTATGPNLSFVVLASLNLFQRGSVTTRTTTKKRSMNYAFVCLYPTLIDFGHCSVSWHFVENIHF